jgi:hypothetical protein
MKAALIYTLCAATSASAKYVWPSRYDKIDDMYYLQSGYIADGTLSDRGYLSIVQGSHQQC